MSGLGLLGKLKQRRGDAKLEYEWGSSKVLQTLDLDKLPRAALRSHLDARDLETGGTKRAMVKRLQADLEGERLQVTAYTEQLESEFHINKDIEERGSVYAYISASRGAAAPSRHRRDSFPGIMEVGGFFFEFEAVRTAFDGNAPRRQGVRRHRRFHPAGGGPLQLGGGADLCVWQRPSECDLLGAARPVSGAVWLWQLGGRRGFLG